MLGDLDISTVLVQYNERRMLACQFAPFLRSLHSGALYQAD